MEDNKSRYCTKKKGKTEVYPLRTVEDIKNMIDYFIMKEQWHHYLTFMFGLLLGRRVGDCLSLSWSDLFYENGKIKNEIDTLEEEKTGKMTRPYINKMSIEAVNIYIEKTHINPIDNFEFDIFESERKKQWRSHCEQWEGYKTITLPNDNENIAMNKICQWRELIGKLENEDCNPDKIYLEWIKHQNQKRNVTLESFLIKEEYSIAIRSLAGSYRAAFSKAAKFCEIDYPVSTHSVRKSFGMWSRILHPYDMDSMLILQKIYGHAKQQVTINYIGLTREKEIKYYEDIGNFVSDILDGKKPTIKNTPVIAIKSTDLRDILRLAFLEGKKSNTNGEDSIEVMNRLLEMVEEMRIS